MVSSEQASEDPTDLLRTILQATAEEAVSLAAIDPDAFVSAADEHGVLPLVAARLLRRRDLPRDLADRLHAAAQRAIVDDLVQDSELRRALEALESAGLRPVVMKGAQLAFSYYERPDLRPRVDSDVLVAKNDTAAAGAVLEGLGYRPRAQTHGDLVTYQAAYALVRDRTTLHVIDLHWRTTNPQRFGAILAYPDVLGAAVPVPALGKDARGLGPAHALLLACVHPVAHHANEHHLLWQYDIHLIASRFGADDWRAFVASARANGVAGVCRWSLARTVDDLSTSVPHEVWRALDDDSTASAATSAYLASGRRHVQHVWWDLRSLTTWRDRGRLMRQHLFPSAWYMRQVYAPASLAPLPWLYARRVWHGAQKWLARSD